ncbi:MAG: hypothetical protein AB8B55_20845 [Mariniblastus sp.]
MATGQARYDEEQQRYFIDLAITGLEGEAPESWKVSFEYASEMLFVATMGQMQLGNLYWLSQGNQNDVDDVFLRNGEGGSVTIGAVPRKPLSGYIAVTRHAKKQPLIIVHEFGHFIFGLAEEYLVLNDSDSTCVRLCSNDASTQRSIMEFAGGHGIKLNADGSVAPPEDQPQAKSKALVSHFCYKNHPADPLNAQQQRHGKSCWETMVEYYPRMKLPPGLQPNKIVPVTWRERTNINQYSMAILGSKSFAPARTTQAIKNVAKAMVDLVGGSEHHLGLFSDSHPNGGIVRPLGLLPTDEQKIELAAQIDKLDFDPAIDTTGLMQTLHSYGFSPKDSIGAYQHLVILAPGDYPEDLSPLIPLLAEYRVQLSATTYGPGSFRDQLNKAKDSCKWIKHFNIPAEPESPDAFAFSLQNSWVENYFLNAGPIGIVELKRDKLPMIENTSSIPKNLIPLLPDDKNSNAAPALVNLEVRGIGVDVPVLIEETAETAWFILSEIEAGSIALSLITPDGIRLNRDSKLISKSMDGQNVHWYRISKKDMPIAGRWFVRLRRIKKGHELPYQLMVTAENIKIFVDANFSITGNQVAFVWSTIFDGKPLDYVDPIVDVYQTYRDEEHKNLIHRSVVLEREYLSAPERAEVSNGKFVGSLELEPGDYVAIFRISNSGRAAFATNVRGNFLGNSLELEQTSIPSFTRMAVKRFTIPHQ